MSRRGVRRLVLLLVVLALAVGGVVGLRALRTLRLEQQEAADRREGLALAEAGRWEEALAPLSRAVSADDTDLEVLLVFADTRSRVEADDGGHLFEAINLFRVAIANAGDDPDKADAAREARWAVLRLGPQVQLWDVVAEAGEQLQAGGLGGDERLAWLNVMAAAADAAAKSAPELRSIQRAAETLPTYGLALSIREAAVDGGARLEGRDSIVAPLAFQLALAAESPSWAEGTISVLGLLGERGVPPASVLALYDEWIVGAPGASADAGTRSLVRAILLRDAADVIAAAETVAAAEPRPIHELDARFLLRIQATVADGVTEALRTESDPGRSRRLEELWPIVAAAPDRMLDALVAGAGTQGWPHALSIRHRLAHGRDSMAADALANVPEAVRMSDPHLPRLAGVLALLAGEGEVARAAADELDTIDLSTAPEAERRLRAAWSKLLRIAAGVPDPEETGPEIDPASVAIAIGGAADEVLGAATFPSLSRRRDSDADAALFFKGRALAAAGDGPRAVQALAAARRLRPESGRIVVAFIEACIDSGRTSDALAAAIDTTWWGAGSETVLVTVARAWTAAGPGAGSRPITLAAGRTLSRPKYVQQIFGMPSNWSELGAELLLQCLAWDTGAPGLIAFGQEVEAAGDSVPAAGVLRVAAAVVPHDPNLAERLVADLDPAELSPYDVWRRDSVLASAQGREGPRPPIDLIRDEDPKAADRLEWSARVDAWLDGSDSDGALAAAVAAESDPIRIIALLERSEAWTDPAIFEPALSRLETLIGPDSLVVRRFRFRGELESVPQTRRERDEALAGILQRVEAALSESPGDPGLLRIKAAVLVDGLGVADAASRGVGIDVWTAVVATSPGDLRATIRLIELLQRDGRWADAGRRLENAVATLGAVPEVAPKLADLLVRQGRPADAIDILRSAGRDQLTTSLQLARLLDATDRHAEAAERVEMLRTDPRLKTDERAGALAALANYLVPTKGREAAFSWLEAATAEVSEPRRSIVLADFHLKTGRADDAVLAARRARSVDPSDGDAGGILLLAEAEAGRDAAELAAIVNEVVQAVGAPAPGLIRALQALPPAALADLPAPLRAALGSRSLSRDDMAELAAVRGRVLAAVRDAVSVAPAPGDARILRGLIERQPTMSLPRHLLSDWHLASGDPSGALEVVLDGMRRIRGDVDLASRAARLAASLGRRDDAIEAARAWYDRTAGGDRGAVRVLADVLLDARRFREARAFIDPALPAAWAALEPASGTEGPDRGEAAGLDPATARDLVLTAIRIAAAESSPTIGELADRAIEAGVKPFLVASAALPGDRAEARRLVALAADSAATEAAESEVDAERLEAARLQLRLDTRHGDPEALARAGETVRSVLDSENTLPVENRLSAVGLLARIDSAAGNRSGARAGWRTILAARPGDLEASNNLAFLLAVSGTDCAEARRLAGDARAAVERMGILDGGIRASVLATAALSFSCDGDHAAAVPLARDAARLDSRSPSIAATLAVVLQRSGDSAGSASARATAVSLRRGVDAPERDPDTDAILALLGPG